MLGQNQYMKLSDPRPTVQGISCRLVNVQRGGRELIDVFRGYDPRCSDVRETVNDETGDRQYRVDIPFPLDGGRDEALRRDRAERGWFWRLADDPRFVLGGLMATATLAAFTTRADQWASVLAAVAP